MPGDAPWSEALLRYTRHAEKRVAEDPTYEPHPMMKALMLALSGATEAGVDGVYSGVAGLETELAYMVAVEKRGGRFEVKDVVDLNTGRNLSPGAMTRITDAEIALDEHPAHVPVDAAVGVMRRAMPDTKIELLREDCAAEALGLAKKLIRGRKTFGAPPGVEVKVLSASASKWSDLPSEVRAFVGSIWASQLGAKGSVMVITSIEPTVPKRKVRHTISLAVQWVR